MKSTYRQMNPGCTQVLRETIGPGGIKILHAEPEAPSVPIPRVVDLTRDQWERIVNAHGSRCAYCGRRFWVGLLPTIDHLIPIAEGGNHTASNVIPVCMRCNPSKDRLLEPLDVASGEHRNG